MTDTISPTPPQGTRSLEVLVVDDDPLILTVVDLMIRHAGHKTRTAGDAPTALDAFADGAVDVLVSDIRMPGMDGIALARVVREDYPKVPIILMTGYLADYTNGSANQIGVDGIIKKPFKSSELLDMIDRATRH